MAEIREIKITKITLANDLGPDQSPSANNTSFDNIEIDKENINANINCGLNADVKGDADQLFERVETDGTDRDKDVGGDG